MSVWLTFTLDVQRSADAQTRLVRQLHGSLLRALALWTARWKPLPLGVALAVEKTNIADNIQGTPLCLQNRSYCWSSTS
jgi:hypothetical protein